MDRHCSQALSRVIALLALTTGALPIGLSAQQSLPPGPITNWVEIQDSVWVSRIRSGGDTLDPLDVTQAFIVEMLGDSTCAARYTWADCRINSAALRFYHWDGRSDRIVSTAANLLSWNTRTLPVTLRTGDTITCYRHLYWYDPQTRVQGVNRYVSRDTLSYTLELIRTRDSLRAVKLDSIGVMPSPVPGIPIVHGSRPIMALVTFIVPSSLNNEEVFIRLHLYDRGEGDFFFERRDQLRMAPRRALADPFWLNYLQAWGTSQQAKSVTGAEVTSPNARLNVSVDHGAMVIRFTPEPDAGATAVAVYKTTGQLLFYPFITPESYDSGEGTVIYRSEESGAYIVGLLHKGKLVRTQKITITR